jgi:NAD(P)-dependent dehydrogenase (short-subunit alcohol dehydrogenase family)/acyl carrier protein
MTAVGRLYTWGVEVDWRAVFGGARVVELPTYAFQRQRYWLDAVAPDSDRDPVDAEFWDVVQRGDLEALRQELGVDPEQPLGQVLPVLSRWRDQRHQWSVVDSWRYQVTWRPLTGTAEKPSGPGTWIVVVPDGVEQGWVGQVIHALADSREVHRVSVAGADSDRETLAGRLRAAASSVGEVLGVVSLLAVDQRPHPDHSATSRGVAGCLVLAQAFADAGIEARLWVVTRSAVGVDGSDAPVDPVQAQVWGLGRVVGLEQPHRWGGLVDLPDAVDGRVGGWLRAVLGEQAGEDQVAVRRSGVWGRRLLPAPVGSGGGSRQWAPRGTVLVTGGTGALGAHVARWAAEHGADHVVVTSRRGMAAPGAAGLRAELGQAGAQVTVAECDVTDRAAVAALIARIDTDDMPLTAVVHAAGVTDFAAVDRITVDQFASVMAAKVAGARHLHDLTSRLALDAFVLFSSGAGVWGSAGNGAYAAASAFLDAMAEHRRALGLVATSVAWGSWDGEGMAAGEAGELLSRRGMRPMAAESAVLALAQAVGRAETAVAVADVDWHRFAPAFTLARPSPLIAGIPDVQRALRAAEPEPDGTREVERLAGLSEAQRRRVVAELVYASVAAVLGHDSAASIDATRPFDELGFTSLTAVELRNSLVQATGLPLPATMIFDYPTPAVLAEHLSAQFGADESVVDSTVLDDIDRLAVDVATTNPDDDTRSKIIIRLQTIIANMSGGSRADGAAVSSFESVTDDEIFDLIDNDLGVPDSNGAGVRLDEKDL